MRENIKKLLPLELRQKLKPLDIFVQKLFSNKENRETLRLFWKDYSNLHIKPNTKKTMDKTLTAAKAIYGDQWDYYSGAMRREVLHTFQVVVEHLSSHTKEISYLEIGSAQGLSMSLISGLINEVGFKKKLCSLDPYFDTGYLEGSGGVLRGELQVDITNKTREKALQLYKKLGHDVTQIRLKSNEGLIKLLKDKQKFNLIYIDGYHEELVPTLDFALSYQLLEDKGIIMLDDYRWSDIKDLKRLCDKHLTLVHECWKVAAYQV